MENQDRCPSCGALALPGEKFCRRCGAALQGAGAQQTAMEPDLGAGELVWQPGAVPTTIAQLVQFCTYNHMPLERMRFFLDQDYRDPKAFGIYRDGDQYIVYKNKADGSRAVRYHGPDEAYAVSEIYAKLLDECHKRDIWPDGKPKAVARRQKQARRRQIIIMAVVVIVILAFAVIGIFAERRAHTHDGYYRFDDGMYYLYGDSWYYDDPYYDWVEREPVYYDDYSDYYMGSAYDSGWGYSDFRESDTWEDIHESHSGTSSSDYDSWDSGDTDWGSDW